MIEFLSSWAKSLGLAIVIISILEMLLPNNKTKKYIRMVMGIYVIFTMISPLIDNKEMFNVNNIDFEEYSTVQTISTTVDQTSMDKRIQELYAEELEKDITKKIQEKGYLVSTCKVNAQMSDNEDETKISKIRLKVEKIEVEESKIEENNADTDEKDTIESKIVTQIQKIKPIDISINNEKVKTKNNTEQKVKIGNADIQNIKKFLIEEYGVSEKCLEIN